MKQIDQKSLDYLNMHIIVTDEVKQIIENHAEKYEIDAEICAWYKDMDDFYDDWCNMCEYTKEEADDIFNDDQGEFLVLPNNLGIIRFVI